MNPDLYYADRGPFDIIGDVHGCYDELRELLETLGYGFAGNGLVPPAGRRLIFLGDLVDRGPKTPEVLELAWNSVVAGHALCLPGNHDVKLARALRGKKVKIANGLAESLAQIAIREKHAPGFSRRVQDFIESLPNHYRLDKGALVVAHAGMSEELQGKNCGAATAFALYGPTSGELDAYGLPVRYPWAADYRGAATVLYGHTPVETPRWLNNTLNIDTGCAFGGALTALRYPEITLHSVSARTTYAEPRKPFRNLPQTAAAAALSQQP